jgi:hypothetical protein
MIGGRPADTPLETLAQSSRVITTLSLPAWEKLRGKLPCLELACFEEADQIQPLQFCRQRRDTQGSPQQGLRRLPTNHSTRPTFRMGRRCNSRREELTQRSSDAVPSYVPLARGLPMIATGLTGEPVAPTSLSGVQTKKKR